MAPSINTTYVQRNKCYPGQNSHKWIVVHYSANNEQVPPIAKNNCIYTINGPYEASAHYFIDNGSVIYQSTRESDGAWSIGDAPSKNGANNTNSINIEVCGPNKAFTTNEIENLKWLVQKLMKQYGIKADHVHPTLRCNW